MLTRIRQMLFDPRTSFVRLNTLFNGSGFSQILYPLVEGLGPHDAELEQLHQQVLACEQADLKIILGTII